VFSGNLGSNHFIVQVTPYSVLLLSDSELVQTVPLDLGLPVKGKNFYWQDEGCQLFLHIQRHHVHPAGVLHHGFPASAGLEWLVGGWAGFIGQFNWLWLTSTFWKTKNFKFSFSFKMSLYFT
jgi:hypothetical protein